MQVVGVIPARYASSRFPGKPLADLLGWPLIRHVYERAAGAKTLDRLVVATDDQRIEAAVQAFGGEVLLTAATHPTGTDRVAEVARMINGEIVVNIQGDEPLIVPEMIDQLVEPLLAESTLPIGTLCRAIQVRSDVEALDVVKVVRDRRGNALYFSRLPIPYLRPTSGGFTVHGSRFTDEVRSPMTDHESPATTGHPSSDCAAEPRWYKHIGLYGYRRDSLLHLAALPPTPLEVAEGLEQLRALEHGFTMRVVETTHDTIEVDRPEDLRRVAARIREAGGPG
ncbi:MAG: 3-deoxy-manno-octulosonate cytidylyltransferase [Candidatus Methylomirabilales bacterium]